MSTGTLKWFNCNCMRPFLDYMAGPAMMPRRSSLLILFIFIGVLALKASTIATGKSAGLREEEAAVHHFVIYGDALAHKPPGRDSYRARPCRSQPH